MPRIRSLRSTPTHRDCRNDACTAKAWPNRLFHWQSQSTTSAASDTGNRYIQHEGLGYLPMLFVRERATRPNGLTAPFVFLGPLTYVKHEGHRPMSITWRLDHPMPARVVRWSREAV